ncbi:MAG: Ycf51 family protein [Alkalinema sp. FL-bin-369]|nr:Ycf51 family protein [Leptolyngbyaceae cyanobacterium LF-bin-369]
MFSTEQLISISQWMAILTIVLGSITGIAFVTNRGFRFRMVGVTGFTGVLTVGVFALGLSLYQRPSIPDAQKFVRVFDRASNQVVITVSPEITAPQLEATLRQAVTDLSASGRTSPDGTLTVRARVLLHSSEGVSQPLYLGAAIRSLDSKRDGVSGIQVDVDTETLDKIHG